MVKRARWPGSGYAVALLALTAATLINLATLPWTRTIVTPLFFAAVIVAAWGGGLGPSLLAAAGALVIQEIIRSAGSNISHTERTIRAVIFFSAAAFVSSLVAARRRAESSEHERRVWYEGMLTGVGDCVVAAGADGRVSFLNSAAEEMTGWPAAEAIGRPISDVISLVHEEGDHSVTSTLRSGVQTPIGRSAALVDRGGRIRPIDGHASPIRTPDGAPAGAVAIFRDAAERRRGEEVASELAAIVASSSDAIICRGLDDRITSWNPGAEKLFGYAAAEAIGRPISMLLPPDRTDEMPRMLTRIEGGTAISHYETERVDKDGRRLDISVGVSPLRDGDGRIAGMVTIARDVTERRQAERRMAVQYAVGRVLAESPTVAVAFPRLLEVLGTTLLWDAALFWRVDAAAKVLRCEADWSRGRPAPARVVEAYRGMTLRPGERLPGRIWSELEPAWVSDLAEDAASARAPGNDTPRSAAAFAIHRGEEPFGVIELLGFAPHPRDDALLGLFRLVASQIGLFVERRRAEDELRVAEARFRRLDQSGILGILVADVDENLILDANDAFLDLIGATREDLAAGPLDWQAMTPPEYREIDARAVAQLRETGVCDPFVKEFIGLHGRRVSVLLGAALLDAGTSRCIVFLIDITERRRAEDALRHREEQLRLALDVARMGTWDWNLLTDEVEWSEDLDDIFRLPRGAFGGTFPEFFRMVHPDDRATLRAAIDGALAGDDEFEIEFRVVAPDGATPWVNGRGRAFRDALGRPIRMVGVGLDVTGRKQAERDLQAAKDAAEAANLAKDQFLAVLSHELRTPLTPVLAAVSAMLDDPDTPDDYRSVLRMVRRNVDLEARLIDDLLDVTRISSGKLRLETQAVDAHELLCQALEICIGDVREKDLRLDIALDARAHHVEADPARLQQVYWNLIKNGVKFTPAGGSLAIRTRDGEGGRLVVEVVDTGQGIDAETLPRIFNAFEQGDAAITRRFGGLGLGLAISRSLVELHGGSLTASSEGRERGSTFRVEMSAVPAPPESDADGRLEPGPAEPVGKSGPLRILLVEDNEDSLHVLSRLLRSRGHDVATADSVASAVEAAASNSFDLLISDLGLPDGTGLDVLRGVRDHTDCPAIALSGYGMESDIQRSLEAGFAAHLVKPLEMDQLEAAIRTVLGVAAVAPEAKAR
ncbi:MAG TPA: PAS domain S-box protein [Isosphaeraceae bacterium]|nr:PAS domain S-box protein [Isosphaeraceae bacterium]